MSRADDDYYNITLFPSAIRQPDGRSDADVPTVAGSGAPVRLVSGDLGPGVGVRPPPPGPCSVSL